MNKHTYKLLIEYDGTRYHGWQEQRNARTIAEEIKKAAEEAFGGPVELGGAGRTDSGVHAIGQVAHVRTTKLLKPFEALHEINDRLPADINVYRLYPAAPRFHARYDALGRYYLYQIATERTAFGKRYVWWVRNKLDLAAMRQAAQHFIGMRDFTHFSQTAMEIEPSGRKAAKGESTRVDVHHISLNAVPGLITLRFGASHFLWKMVRRMVGTLVQVGWRNLPANDIPRLLKDGSRDIAAWTAPPSGLFFEHVEYPNEKPLDLGQVPRIGAGFRAGDGG